MINYDDTVKIEAPDAPRSPSDRLYLPASATVPQTTQAMSARSQAHPYDALLCQVPVASVRWWLFVALFLSIVLSIGISLLFYQIL